MRRVLHAVGRFLSRTETFIYTIVTHHQDYEATVLCQSRLFADEFPFARVHVLPKPHTKRSVGWWFDASVERAVKRASPLKPPPPAYRKDWADVTLTFSPGDLRRP